MREIELFPYTYVYGHYYDTQCVENYHNIPIIYISIIVSSYSFISPKYNELNICCNKMLSTLGCC